MTDDYQATGQYRIAVDSINEYLTDREDLKDVAGFEPVLIALSNLAVAEAIHRVAAVLERSIEPR